MKPREWEQYVHPPGGRVGWKAHRRKLRRAAPKGKAGWNQPLCKPDNDRPLTRQQQRQRLRERAARELAERYSYRVAGRREWPPDFPRSVRRAIVRDRASREFREMRAGAHAAAAGGAR